MKKTVKWVIDNIDKIKQCKKCGSLNHQDNNRCISCYGVANYFIKLDEENEVTILKQTHYFDKILYI